MLDILSANNVRRLALKRLPVLTWLPYYRPSTALADLIAGITVGLTLIPQSIAYAALAGLHPQYGLYSALAGAVVYIVFGTCKEVNIGPTALLSLLTLTYTHDTSPDMAVLLCFLTGCVVLVCGILQLGFLVEFVSVPVVAGFTSASAIIIASSQVKGLFGLSYKSEGFVESWKKLCEHIGETELWDTVLGVCCIIILLCLRKLKDVKLGEEGMETSKQKAISKLCFFIATGRNAMVVVICAAMAYGFENNGKAPFKLTGHIEAGLPIARPPPFSTFYGNQTHDFFDMAKHLGSGIAIVPIIAILGNVAIAKSFSSGAMLDATQEMITLGFCNIVGSFVRSMPINGSFTRSAVNNASGVRTPFGGLYTAIMVILALSLLTPYFYFIPKATLSAVIICAVLFMVEVSMVKLMWKSNKRDLVPGFVTLIACLGLGVELGIVIGVAVDIAFLLYFNARPGVTVDKKQCSGGPEYVLVTPNAGLLFPAVDFLREAVSKAGVENVNVVVLNCRHVTRADFTAAQGIQSLIQDFKRQNKHVVFHLLSPSVAKILSPKEELCISDSDAKLEEVVKELKQSSSNDSIKQYTKLEMAEVDAASENQHQTTNEHDTRF
ncbi:sodium-independent sulfate anion transporter-like isoform X2 [Periplaneta americana]